jgi:hypothetical protein
MGGACFHGIHSLVGKRKVSLVKMDQHIVVIQRRPEHLLCERGGGWGVGQEWKLSKSAKIVGNAR